MSQFVPSYNTVHKTSGIIALCRAWYGMEDDFSIFHAGNVLPFHTENLPFHAKTFFHIPFHTSILKVRLDLNERTSGLFCH